MCRGLADRLMNGFSVAEYRKVLKVRNVLHLKVIVLKAAVLYRYSKIKEKPLKIEDVDVERPKSGEILLKVKSAGICRSDMHVIEGKTSLPLPVVLGHEFMGEVEDVGEGVTSVCRGDIVVSSPVWPCGKCTNCITGHENLCVLATALRTKGVLLDGTTRLRSHDGKYIYTFLGGGFAEYAVVPEFGISKLPPQLRGECYAILGCAVITAYNAVINTAKVRLGEKVAIFGVGGIGVNLIQFCKIAGATEIIAVDIIDKKLSLAKEFGATYVINSSEKDPINEIRKVTNGGAQVTFEAVGLPGTIYQAIESTHVGGKAVLLGMMPMNAPAQIHAARVVRNGIRILGSYNGRPRIDLPVIFELIVRGMLDVDKLVTKRWSLEQINEAFETLEKGEVIRSIVIPT